MSHLKHIFVSINGPWTGKIIPPVPLPISSGQSWRTQYFVLRWKRKTKRWEYQRSRNRPCGHQGQLKTLPWIGYKGKFGLIFAHHFPFFHWFPRIPGWFYPQERIYEGELGSSRVSLLSRWMDSVRLPLLWAAVSEETPAHIFNWSSKITSQPSLPIIIKMINEQQNNGITPCQISARWTTEIKYFM